jgi:muconolactone D-isomerase
MLYMVEMDVRLPHDLAAERADELKARERELSQRLQRDGVWRHLWRVAGRYANVSIFDVASNDELHQLLSSLPLYPFMDVRVTALARHPSAIVPPDSERGET